MTVSQPSRAVKVYKERTNVSTITNRELEVEKGTENREIHPQGGTSEIR